MKKTKAYRVSQKLMEESPAMRELYNMRHRDVQIACIVRGMPPPDVVNLSHPKLVTFFCNNYERSQDEKLLLEFDIWREGQLKELGYKENDVLMSPALRFSYVGNIEEMKKPQSTLKLPAAADKPKKEKAVINEETGVREGTKKAMTYKLAMDGKELNKTIEAVMKAFPEAQEKSIKIWYKRAINSKK